MNIYEAIGEAYRLTSGTKNSYCVKRGNEIHYTTSPWDVRDENFTDGVNSDEFDYSLFGEEIYDNCSRLKDNIDLLEYDDFNVSFCGRFN